MRSSVWMAVMAAVLALPPAAAGARQDAGEGGPLLLIMDSSGSMNEVDDAGVPLIEGAKQALRVLVSALPEGAQVGLRVYGHRVPATDRGAGCRDTELVIPVGPIDREAMREAIDTYEAKGFTPIGLSLQEAAADLGGTGTIVLVSDGLDTCAPPDPCDVAAGLVAEGFGLTVHTVGLFLDDAAAEQQLQCIADATGGRFERADSIVDLVRQLAGLATAAVGEAGGFDIPVVIGALEMGEAPVLDLSPWVSGADYRFAGAMGTIGAGETRWYAVDLGGLEPPSHLMATARLNDWQLEPGGGDYLEVRLFDSGGVEIGMPYEVLGVPVTAPQRTLLAEATDWVDYGDRVPAESVTDPHAAFPAWETVEVDPAVAGMQSRFHAAGVNGGMYELFKLDAAPPGLEPGLYFAGVTWSGAGSGMSDLEVSFNTYPAAPAVAERDRPQETVILGPGESPVLELPAWNGPPLGGEAPLRSVEVWMPLTPGETSSFSFDAERGEVLEMGIATNHQPWPGYGGDYRFSIVLEGGVPVHQLDLDLEVGSLRIGGYESPTAWRLLEGAHTVSVTAPPGEGGEEPGIRFSLFVFAPEPEPAPATTAPESEAAPEPGVQDDGGSSAVPIGVGAGLGVVVLAAAGVWWARSRRTG